MKKSILLAASLFALNLTPVWGQNYTTLTLAPGNQPALEATNLTKFNLDFPGGTPAELVKAIELRIPKPLNVIIPHEDSNFQLPALKLNEITFPQLSGTLRQGSFQMTSFHMLDGQYRTVEVGYYFRTSDNPPTDNSIWYFYAQHPPPGQTNPPIQKICQFYSLSPYLDRGFTVDDITTAIQTGWKMAGETPTPELNYHKETKLLIAFGEPNKLQTIQQVLQTLPSVNQEFWRQANNNIRELQQQVDQLKKQINTPPRGSSDPFDLRQLLEIRQSETNASTNTPAERSGK